MALAKALVEIRESKGEGIFIVLTTIKKRERDKWEDRVKISEIRQRLKIIIKGSRLS